MKAMFGLFGLLALASSLVYATTPIPPPPPPNNMMGMQPPLRCGTEMYKNDVNCEMVENVYVRVVLSEKLDNVEAAEKIISDINKKVEQYATELKGEVKLVARNINVNPVKQNEATTYTLDGQISYRTKQLELAFKLAEFLKKQNINFTINSYSDTPKNCQNF